MTPKLKAFFEVNTFNANRRRSLEFALNLYSNRIIHVIIQGEPGCQAHTSISEQICVITTVTFVKSWSNFVPKDAQAKLLIFVDGKCHIQPDAFAEFLFAHLNGAKVIYADSGVYPLSDEQDIFCKPSFSPELLLSFQYLGNVIGIDSELFTAQKGFSQSMRTAQLYDFLLRLQDEKSIVHIPRVLYFTPRKNDIPPANITIEDYKKAILKALSHRKSHGVPQFTNKTQRDGQPTFNISFPSNGPSVAILIASRNNLKILATCLQSIKCTTYKNYSVIIVDNDSDDPEMLEWLNNTTYQVITVGSPNGKFNFSYIYNTAIKQVHADYILLLNSDTAVITPNWLSDMVGYAQIPGVGSVGARLRFEHGSIQHCGICHNMQHGFPATAFRHLLAEEDGYWQLSRLSCNHMAETAACLLTSRELYLRQGGLDEKNFGVAFNDCDYGYRLTIKGYRNVFCSTAELYHLENATRGPVDNPTEEAAYIRKYSKLPDNCRSPLYFHGENGSYLSSHTIITTPTPCTRLLMVMHDLTRTGACRNACYIAQQLKKRGAFVPIVLSHLDGPLRQELERAHIEVKILPHFNMLAAKTLNQLEKYKDEMASWVSDFQPDVIYGNTILTFWAIGSAKKLNIPCVWNIRESEVPFSHFDEHSPLIKPYAKECMSSPYQNIFVADATRELFAPFLNNNGITIHNGFDSLYFQQQCTVVDRNTVRQKLRIGEDICILNVGTACERKGQKDLLDAFVALPVSLRRHCKLFFVCGTVETEYKQQMREIIAHLTPQIRERIFMVCDPYNIDHYYVAADIFVCTSRIESFPRVIQEAMACSLPIITTPVFGVVEQVRDKISALFYDQGDKEHLTALISELVNHPDQRQSLGQQASIALDILPDSNDMVESYERIFTEAWLSGSPRSTTHTTNDHIAEISL